MKTRIVVLVVILFSTYSLFAEVNSEKWKVFEITINVSTVGNPFKDVKLSGQFIIDKDTITVPGFFDGDGVFKIRFMPRAEGKWGYVTISNYKKLNNKKGSFICTPPSGNNHGPVAVKDTSK